MPLEKVKGNTYVLPGGVYIGVIDDGRGGCVAIDSGIDAQIGKKLLKALDAHGLTLKAVINTHSHADHIGGNALLQARTGALCYAAPMEAAMIRRPEFEGFYLYSAMPPAQLQTRFVKAEPTREVFDIMPGEHEIGGVRLRVVALRGHSCEQIGIVTQDGVMFAGDAVMTPAVWEKYRIAYMVDVAAQLETLEKLEAMAQEVVVLAAHSGVMDDAKALIAYNREALNRRLEEALEMLRTPMTREQLVGAFAQRYSLAMDATQCVLLHSTVSAYTAYLLREGRVELSVSGGAWVFRAAT